MPSNEEVAHGGPDDLVRDIPARADEWKNPTWATKPDAALIHAMQIGTVLTACGRDTATWHKHWLPFDPIHSRSACCAECSSVVAGSRTPWAVTSRPI
jgi:hypothetical protein